jgi:hypothetical protein
LRDGDPRSCREAQDNRCRPFRCKRQLQADQFGGAFHADDLRCWLHQHANCQAKDDDAGDGEQAQDLRRPL